MVCDHARHEMNVRRGIRKTRAWSALAFAIAARVTLSTSDRLRRPSSRPAEVAQAEKRA